jgi:hypothetical protein
MDNEIIQLLSEEIRQTKDLTRAVQEETKEIRRIAEAAEKKADAAWELVIMTRNEMTKPFWKRMFGL